MKHLREINAWKIQMLKIYLLASGPLYTKMVVIVNLEEIIFLTISQYNKIKIVKHQERDLENKYAPRDYFTGKLIDFDFSFKTI
jgi:hypothetical protein